MSAIVPVGVPEVLKTKSRWPSRPRPRPTPLASAIVLGEDGIVTRTIRKGYEEDSKHWRSAFQAALRTQAASKALHAELLSGKDIEAWRLLRDRDGLRFKSWAQFCSTPLPHGLGASPDDAEHFLRSLLGIRKTDLLLVPPPQQGFRSDLSTTSCPAGTKSKRHEKRLRAVNRAPDAVRRLCERGAITYNEAEAFGPARPTPEQRMTIEIFSTHAEQILIVLGDTPSQVDIDRAREQVKRFLPAGIADRPADTLMRRFKGLPDEERLRFLGLLAEWQQARKEGASHEAQET